MSRQRAAGRSQGFTLLELVMAVAVFTMLGTMVVFLMRQGLDVFTVGTSESSALDRAETILPRMVYDLEALALPPSFDPARLPLTEEERLAGREEVVLPPVDVRLRSAQFLPRDVPEGPLKGVPATYMAWVVNVSEDRSDPWLRRAGSRTGEDRNDLEPTAIDAANVDTAFRASGGLREVCYVAVAEDAAHPALMTLYYGWRSPVGGVESLLDPTNLNSLAKIRARCRPISTGLLHLEARWRRVFGDGWEITTGRIGEREPYVGIVWDSTRALDRAFPLFRDRTSLGDPSDDVFPAWVRLEVTLIPPDALGLGRGETTLAGAVSSEDDRIVVADAMPFVGPGPQERWLKVDGEWMRYDVRRVTVPTRTIAVQRGQRGTKAVPHDGDAEVYVGLSTDRVVRLLFRDLFAVEEARR